MILYYDQEMLACKDQKEAFARTDRFFNTTPGKTMRKWLAKNSTERKNIATGVLVKGNRGRRTFRHKKSIFAAARRGQFHAEELELIQLLRARRQRGLKVRSTWIRRQMRHLTKRDRPACAFKASPGWFMRFCRRHGVTLRAVKNHKPMHLDDRVPLVKKFIEKIRRVRIATDAPIVDDSDSDSEGEGEGKEKVEVVDLTDEWGAYTPYRTHNVDQVPIPFVQNDTKTIDFVGAVNVWVKRHGSGLEKRQFTLQACIRARGKQMPPTLIFRGSPKTKRTVATGNKKRKRKALTNKWVTEAKKYGKHCTVLWQKCAWADTDVCCEWGKQFQKFCQVTEGANSKHLLFTDRLTSQTLDPFYDSLGKNVHCMHGPAKCTCDWQPVDRGIGQVYHARLALKYDDWMEKEGDAHEGTISVSQRRILMTQWVSEVYLELEAERRALEEAGKWKETVFYKAFERTGCLVGRTGKDDKDIRPLNYDKFFYKELQTPAEARKRVEDAKATGLVIDLDSSDDEGDENEATAVVDFKRAVPLTAEEVKVVVDPEEDAPLNEEKEFVSTQALHIVFLADEGKMESDLEGPEGGDVDGAEDAPASVALRVWKKKRAFSLNDDIVWQDEAGAYWDGTIVATKKDRECRSVSYKQILFKVRFRDGQQGDLSVAWDRWFPASELEHECADPEGDEEEEDD